MPITWKLEVTTVANGNNSLEQSMQFEADTIKEAKEEADNLIQNTSPLSGVVPDLDWTLDKQANRITKVYMPQRTWYTQRGIEIEHLPEWYVAIEPVGISLSAISDYADMQ